MSNYSLKLKCTFVYNSRAKGSSAAGMATAVLLFEAALIQLHCISTSFKCLGSCMPHPPL